MNATCEHKEVKLRYAKVFWINSLTDKAFNLFECKHCKEEFFSFAREMNRGKAEVH